MPTSSFLDKVSAKTNQIVNQAKEATSQVAITLKQEATTALQQLLVEINGLKPILLECGFIVGDINFTFPMPELKMTIEQTQMGKRTLEQIIGEDRGNLSDLQRSILNLMISTNDLVQITSRYGYTFRKYDVRLTLPPKVTIHLVSLKSIG